MDSIASEVECVLKVHVRCEACRMHLIQMLKSISGVYDVTIDAEKGLAKVVGKVDPNILIPAITRAEKHAELKWINFKHPNHYAAGGGGSNYYNHHGVQQDGYNMYGGYGSHGGYYGPMNQSYYSNYYRGGSREFGPAEGMHWGDTTRHDYWPQRWPQVTDNHHRQQPSYYYGSSLNNYGYLPHSGTHYY